MNIYGIIDAIRKNPSMYIGEKSISHLHSFLMGFSACERYNHLADETRLLPLDFWYMNEYVAHRYNDDYSAYAGWAYIILQHCGGDEEKALDKFFDLYDDFKAVEVTACRKAVLTDENRAYHEDYGAYKVDENGIRITQLYAGAQRLYEVVFSGRMGSVLMLEHSGKRKIIRAPLGGTEQFVRDHFGENVTWEKFPVSELETLCSKGNY